MFEVFTTSSENDAIGLLKKDHTKVKGLFEQFEKTENRREKKRIVAEAIMELKIHATIEEEIFYAALRREEVEKDLLNEADEEHHVAKLLIAELEQMDGTEDHYDAKFTVLAENIRHHIKEEEGDMFPQARKTDVDFDALAQQLLARKKQLMKTGVPVSDEEKMISRTKGKVDSPARAARETRTAKPVRKPAAKAPISARSRTKVAAKGKTTGPRNAKPATPARKAPAKKTQSRGQR
jgi:hypothetical protein